MIFFFSEIQKLEMFKMFSQFSRVHYSFQLSSAVLKMIVFFQIFL